MIMENYEAIKKHNMGGFGFGVKSVTLDHLGGFGEIIDIKKKSVATFQLDILIRQLQNARRLLNPTFDEEDEYDWSNFYVIFWENRPCLVCEMTKETHLLSKDGYVIAPIIGKWLEPLNTDALPDSSTGKVGKPEAVKLAKGEALRGGVGGEVTASGRTTAGASMNKNQPTRRASKDVAGGT